MREKQFAIDTSLEMHERRVYTPSESTSKDSRCNRCELDISSVEFTLSNWNNRVSCRRKHRTIQIYRKGRPPKTKISQVGAGPDCRKWKIFNTGQIQCRKIWRSAQGLNGRCEIHWKRTKGCSAVFSIQGKLLNMWKTEKDGRHDSAAGGIFESFIVVVQCHAQAVY